MPLQRLGSGARLVMPRTDLVLATAGFECIMHKMVLTCTLSLLTSDLFIPRAGVSGAVVNKEALGPLVLLQSNANYLTCPRFFCLPGADYINT